MLVVLLLGVTTDYSVFFLDDMRRHLAEGVPRVRAARLATAESAPIIAAAGLIVTAAAASLLVARTQLLRAFGPGLALTVLTAMVVSMTLGPALIAVFGGLLFRPLPARLRRRGASRREGVAVTVPRLRPWNPTMPSVRPAAVWTRRPVALMIAVACTAVGVVIDAIAVRSLLVPALVALFGRLGMWPAGRRAQRVPVDPRSVTEPTRPAAARR